MSTVPNLITNVRIVQPGKAISLGSLVVEDGKITSIAPTGVDIEVSSETLRVEGGGKLLTPGLIDIHTHGIGPFLYERSPADIQRSIEFLARHGTTCVLPTLVHMMNRSSLKHLESLSEAAKNVTGVCFPGFHLEGPFLALPGAGTDTVPGDVILLEEMISACKGRITAMSISPDTANIMPVIERLVEKGIIPFITHTRASAEQTQAAIDAGARNATHFYDVFPVPKETEPGVRPVGAVEAVLADPRCTVDFVCDGVHVHPYAIKAALAAKGYQGVLLATDSNIGAGMPDGIYSADAYNVKISAGDATRIHDPSGEKHGWLAGSALTMDVGMANLHKWLKLPSEQIWAMGTSSVSRMLGLKSKGTIEVGADADLVLWNDDFRAVKTWIGGRIVYEA